MLNGDGAEAMRQHFDEAVNALRSERRGLVTRVEAIDHLLAILEPMRPAAPALAPEPPVAPATRLATVAEAESLHIARVLSHTGGKVREAARILGVHRNTVARKVKERRPRKSA